MEFCLLLTEADIAASVSGSGIDGSCFRPFASWCADNWVGVGLTVEESGDGVLGFTTSCLMEVSSIELEVATLAV